jgi:hypothetical protein
VNINPLGMAQLILWLAALGVALLFTGKIMEAVKARAAAAV